MQRETADGLIIYNTDWAVFLEFIAFHILKYELNRHPLDLICFQLSVFTKVFWDKGYKGLLFCESVILEAEMCFAETVPRR